MSQLDVHEVTAAARASITAAAKEKVDDLSAKAPRLPMPIVAGLLATMLGATLVCWTLWDLKAGMIAAGCGMGLMIAVSVGYGMMNIPMLPYAPPGTLSWEAQLSLSPLSATLESKLAELGAQPTQESLAEVAFLSQQAHVMLDVVKRAHKAPGRGYIGFDAYGAGESTWRI